MVFAGPPGMLVLGLAKAKAKPTAKAKPKNAKAKAEPKKAKAKPKAKAKQRQRQRQLSKISALGPRPWYPDTRGWGAARGGLPSTAFVDRRGQGDWEQELRRLVFPKAVKIPSH